MSTVRRVYIYLICAISLQSFVWALIALLRNFAISRLDPNVTALAFQIAVVVVGLPIFLIHWLWGQRLAGRENEEQEAGLRRFYLYATLASFLTPWITNLYDLIGVILSAGKSLARLPRNLSTTDGSIFHPISVSLPRTRKPFPTGSETAPPGGFMCWALVQPGCLPSRWQSSIC